MVACRESPAGQDNERESEMVHFKNFSSDGVERNRMLSAYDVMKMETGCIGLEVRSYATRS